MRAVCYQLFVRELIESMGKACTNRMSRHLVYLVQRRRDKAAAKKFFRKLLKGLTYVPRVIIPDELASYGAAK